VNAVGAWVTWFTITSRRADELYQVLRERLG